MTKFPLQEIPGPEAPGTTSTTQLDPFDPANLRLSQSFTETVGVKKLLDHRPGAQAQPARFRAGPPRPRVSRELPDHRAEG